MDENKINEKENKTEIILGIREMLSILQNAQEAAKTVLYPATKDTTVKCSSIYYEHNQSNQVFANSNILYRK